ncbi:hypothetical protein M434DRAFT_11104 [Hypoxylon sp. CO27-5]|nr:hypothetical protein M434DRAFT_11104 [Hypoxylon sp. CO27-5]
MAAQTPYHIIALTESSLRARNKPLPPTLRSTCLIPFPLRIYVATPLEPPLSFNYESLKFGDYGRSWEHHVQDIQKWLDLIDRNLDLPLAEREVFAGNRLTCLDSLGDHVVCPDMCLKTSLETKLFQPECHALLYRRFLLIPYEEDRIFVNIVYDRQTHTVSTFDGVERGRGQRHDNAVEALRKLIQKSGLPEIPFVETQMQSRVMKSGDERYNGYVALEGARVFLRETRAVYANWTDWTSSDMYNVEQFEQITETQARVTWNKIIEDASLAWGP